MSWQCGYQGKNSLHIDSERDIHGVVHDGVVTVGRYPQSVGRDHEEMTNLT